MPIAERSFLRWFMIRYSPSPDAREFLSAAESHKRDDLEVRVAVLDVPASRKFFGVPMARRGIQPVWVHVVNRSDRPYRLQFVALDPNHFSPLEAAALNHYSGGKRLLSYGLLAWMFLPLLLAVVCFRSSCSPSAAPTGRWMLSFWSTHFACVRFRPAGNRPGSSSPTCRKATRSFSSDCLARMVQDFEFTLPVEGLRADYLRREFDTFHAADELTEVDMPGLRRYLARRRRPRRTAAGSGRAIPSTWSSSAIFPWCSGPLGPAGTKPKSSAWRPAGRPCGPFSPGPNIATRPSAPCFCSAAARTSPCSGFAVRSTNACTCGCGPRRSQFRGQRVWIGQISRDIGVRLTWRTWNLTTHRIDPDVDEARDYVVEDLMHVGRLEMTGYVDGVGTCDRASPRRNLTGDPYYTDGKRAVIVLSESRTAPEYVEFL